MKVSENANCCASVRWLVSLALMGFGTAIIVRYGLRGAGAELLTILHHQF